MERKREYPTSALVWYAVCGYRGQGGDALDGILESVRIFCDDEGRLVLARTFSECL